MGYRPIIAHPERYHGMGGRAPCGAAVAEVGARLQVNYGSLAGRVRLGGAVDGVQDPAARLGPTTWRRTSTGTHDSSSTRADAWAALEELGAEETLVYLCRTNPGRVLDDEAPLPVPPLPVERGFWAKLRGMIQRTTA